MANDGETRRLVAIMATDVVGYSRLMGADDAGTRLALRSMRADLWDPKVVDHGGRVVKTTGDGQLIEFASVVSAVECAVEIQKAMARRNADIAEDRRIVLRIGVNLGDIIVEGDDIHGDGVNIAARLEGLAEPGGVCVSGKVADEVGNKLEVSFEDLGEQTLKNIADPVRVYRVRPTAAPEVSAPIPGFEGRPAIAVLPFDNMSGDPEQEYFSDGIAEDIITALSRFRRFSVVARNSTFVYKGKPVKVQRVADELGVRYVLEGSVRKAGKRVRITAQLVDATTGNHVWADRYDGGLEDIFDLQDRITERVVGALVPGIEEAEKDRAKRKRPGDVDAYDLYMRGRWSFSQFTQASMSESRDLFLRAIELDSGFAAPYSMLAMLGYLEFIRSRTANPQQTLTEAAQAAQRAISLDGNDAYPHSVLSLCLVLRRQYEVALDEADRAVELNRNYASSYSARSLVNSYGGHPKDGVADALMALRLGPQDPARSVFLTALSVAQYASRDYNAAADAARKWTRASAPHHFGYFNLAAACGQLGRSQEAEQALQEGLRLYPDVSMEFISARWPYKDAGDLDHFVEGLRKAGLPE